MTKKDLSSAGAGVEARWFSGRDCFFAGWSLRPRDVESVRSSLRFSRLDDVTELGLVLPSWAFLRRAMSSAVTKKELLAMTCALSSIRLDSKTSIYSATFVM